MAKRWKIAVLGGAVAIAAILVGITAIRPAQEILAIDGASSTVGTLRYSEFIQQVETDRINQVALSADRWRAVAIRDSQRWQVDLLPDAGLIDLLTKNQVEISVLPNPPDLFTLMWNLLVPLIILGGLLPLLGWLIWIFLRG